MLNTFCSLIVVVLGGHPSKRQVMDALDYALQYRIVGGQDAELNTWPWMVQLEYDTAFNCGGVIVDKNLVLTGIFSSNTNLFQSNKHFSLKFEVEI